MANKRGRPFGTKAKFITSDDSEFIVELDGISKRFSGTSSLSAVRRFVAKNVDINTEVKVFRRIRVSRKVRVDIH